MPAARRAWPPREAFRPRTSPNSVPKLASQMRVAFSSMASNTGSSSPGELEMTRSTSDVAVCCSSDSLRSPVRWRSSLSSRVFSMAMTAWAAKLCSSSICLSAKGRTLWRQERNRTDELVFPSARERTAGPYATKFDGGNDRRVAPLNVRLLSRKIARVNQRLGIQHAAHRVICRRVQWRSPQEFEAEGTGGSVVRGHEPQSATIPTIDIPSLGAAYSSRVIQHALEHRV